MAKLFSDTARAYTIRSESQMVYVSEHQQTSTQHREFKIFIFAECFPYSIIVFLLLTLIALASYKLQTTLAIYNVYSTRTYITFLSILKARSLLTSNAFCFFQVENLQEIQNLFCLFSC